MYERINKHKNGDLIMQWVTHLVTGEAQKGWYEIKSTNDGGAFSLMDLIDNSSRPNSAFEIVKTPAHPDNFLRTVELSIDLTNSEILEIIQALNLSSVYGPQGGCKKLMDVLLMDALDSE